MNVREIVVCKYCRHPTQVYFIYTLQYHQLVFALCTRYHTHTIHSWIPPTRMFSHATQDLHIFIYAEHYAVHLVRQVVLLQLQLLRAVIEYLQIKTNFSC